MNNKLDVLVGKMAYTQKQIYELLNDIQVGDIPSDKQISILFKRMEECNRERIHELRKLNVENVSSSFLEPVSFKDNGEIINAHLYGNVDGALDFVSEQYNSTDMFRWQMARYVAICL